MRKYYPCDGPEHHCPYDDGQSGMNCRELCGLGVDDNETECYIEYDEE